MAQTHQVRRSGDGDQALLEDLQETPVCSHVCEPPVYAQCASPAPANAISARHPWIGRGGWWWGGMESRPSLSIQGEEEGEGSPQDRVALFCISFWLSSLAGLAEQRRLHEGQKRTVSPNEEQLRGLVTAPHQWGTEGGRRESLSGRLMKTSWEVPARHQTRLSLWGPNTCPPTSPVSRGLALLPEGERDRDRLRFICHGDGSWPHDLLSRALQPLDLTFPKSPRSSARRSLLTTC